MPIVRELRERLPLLSGFAPEELFPNPSSDVLEAFAAFAAPVAAYRPPDVVVWDHAASGPHGEVGLRVYEPRTGRRSGAGLVWMHGGAFVGGDLDVPEADVVARCLRCAIHCAIHREWLYGAHRASLDNSLTPWEGLHRKSIEC